MLELIIGVVVLVLILLWYVSTYNRLVRIRNECDRAWSNIDVLLQQRYDMLPNLVNTVKGYADHESEIWTQFAEARQMASNARASGDVGALGRAEGMLSNIMPQIYAVAEQYPELKADQSFLSLQNEIVSMENQIADRREFYNAQVTIWNTAIEVIPANFVANTMGAVRKEQFKVEAAEIRAAPKIEF